MSLPRVLAGIWDGKKKNANSQTLSVQSIQFSSVVNTNHSKTTKPTLPLGIPGIWESRDPGISESRDPNLGIWESQGPGILESRGGPAFHTPPHWGGDAELRLPQK